MTAQEIIKRVQEGGDPVTVVHDFLAEGVSGPDRHDPSPDEIAAKFQQLIAQTETQVPYLNSDYVDQVLSQLRQGAPADELIQLAAKNRQQYAGQANIGVGEFATWDAIHRALTKTFTDQLPPSPGM
jgi:hypothetical protein